MTRRPSSDRSALSEGREIVPDTIVAEATSPGIAALAVVRMSGSECDRILESLCGHEVPEARRATLLPVLSGGTELIDRCVVTRYEGPASYTGEDMVEISCHGGWITPARIVEAVTALGARPAEPGEFTRRAVLNGKMDLLQAEGVIDLIEGTSPVLQRIAVGQVERSLSARISDLREKMVRLEAFLMHHIDFPEEDEAPVSLEQVAAEARVVLESLEELASTAPEGELLREGALAVLAGKPNSGKSSLFNALIGSDRAIVTDTPGTTRDALEATVSIGGFPFRLVDTAGLREAEGEVERLGIEVAHRYLGSADVVLYCADASLEPGSDEHAFLESIRGCPILVLRTKADREGASGESGSGALAGGESPEILISATTGRGFELLRERLPALVYGGLVRVGRDVPVLTRARQAEAVRVAAGEIDAFIRAVESGVPAEMASTHLRPAETALEELLGVISTDDVLERVFSEFCVGK